MKRTKSSQQWLKEHESDIYVLKARAEGYRSRAVYKLLELQEKYHLIKPGMRVVDLGAAPGGWSQIAVKMIGKKGKIIAMDILPMEPIPGVTFIQGDFQEPEVMTALLNALEQQPLDLVISDIAPNISGNKSVDQARSLYLVELALEFAQQTLSSGGTLVAKVFQGEGTDEFLVTVRQCFTKVAIRKPKASRPRSPEVYIVATGFKKPEVADSTKAD